MSKKKKRAKKYLAIVSDGCYSHVSINGHILKRTSKIGFRQDSTSEDCRPEINLDMDLNELLDLVKK